MLSQTNALSLIPSSTTVVMAQTNNALPTLKPKDDKHNIFNDGKERTIRYVEWKDEMKTKARSCAKNHGIKVLMGEMTDIPAGTTAAKKKERFELCLELYGRNTKACPSGCQARI